MTDFNPKPSNSHLTSLTTNSYEIQLFIEEFSHDPKKPKAYTMIGDNFIKKFRYKNSVAHISDQLKSLKQFIEHYRQTLKQYENYHQYLEKTLDKYPFCKDLKKFCQDLRRSEHKSLAFFLDQIEFHKAFMQSNEAKYEQKISEMKQICVNCKQNYNKKLFQKMKNNVVYPFTDPFQLFKKNDHDFGSDKTLSLILQKLSDQKTVNNNDSMFNMGLEQIQLVEKKMHSLIKQSKKISGNGLQEIFDMFEHKEEIELESVNKVRINQMFYDLQNDLNLRSNYIEQYIEELMTFNDRLINYNPNLTNRINPTDQTAPQIVQKQLKFNFQKIVKKIYKKITEIIQKRKDQSISVECQVNFSQQNILRDLQRQKKKLTLQLRQTQQQKNYLLNNLKAQNQRFSKELSQAHQDKVKAQMAKQEAYTDKKNAQKQSDKLIKLVAQMKKQIQRLTYLLQKQKRGSRFGKTDLKTVDKKASKFNDDKLNQKNSDSVPVKANMNNEQKEATHKQQKGLDKYTMEQLQKNQIELISNLANQRLKNKKKFVQPRRSKILDTVDVIQSSLSKQIKRMSNFVLQSNNQFQDNQISSQQSSKSSQKQSNLSSLNNLSSISDNQIQGQNNTLPKGPIQISKITSKSKKPLSTHKQLSPKNHKSKTFTQLFKKGQPNIDDHGKSSQNISQTSQHIQKQLQELQKIQKMKQIQVKLASISRNTKNNHPRKSALEFNIEKQVQYSILAPNLKQNASKSKLKNHLSSQSIQKQELIKRFGKPSIANISNQSQDRLSIKQLQQHVKQPRNSNISISSQNYMNICDQIYKQIEENLCHIGTQATQTYEGLLKILFEMEVINRKFNQKILTFDSFKFGYEEFLTQLMTLILKEEANPIRKLNSYKGSSSILKKNHNYRFTKENLVNRTWKEEDGENAFQNTMTKAFSRTIDERSYFVPRVVSEEKKPLINMNQTMCNFKYNQISANGASYKLLNCVTITDFKSLDNRSQHIKDTLTTQEQGLKKKGCYTLHNVKSGGTVGISEEQDLLIKLQEVDEVQSNNQTIQENRLAFVPSFQRQDAEDLFFSIESAKLFEQRIFNQNTNHLPMMALEQHQIKLSTQILTILAHIHLIHPAVYQQIKQLILYPAKVLASKNNQIKPENNTQNQAELSLKKGLGFIIQLHRNCFLKGTSHQKPIKNGRTTHDIRKKRNSACIHLQNFKSKIAQVIKAEGVLKDTSNQQSHMKK